VAFKTLMLIILSLQLRLDLQCLCELGVQRSRIMHLARRLIFRVLIVRVQAALGALIVAWNGRQFYIVLTLRASNVLKFKLSHLLN
jgi:hypothetical protein